MCLLTQTLTPNKVKTTSTQLKLFYLSFLTLSIKLYLTFQRVHLKLARCK